MAARKHMSESSLHGPQETPLVKGAWHRRLILFHRIFSYYVLAVIFTTHAYFFMELLDPARPPIFLHIQLITWIVPGILTLGALFLEKYFPAGGTRMDLDRPLRELAPTLVGLVVFGLWAGGYFLVGAIGAHLSQHTMHSFLDDRIPRVPQAVFIYLTVYPAALLPFLWEDSLERSLRTAAAYLVVLGISFVVMLLYPVVLPHPKPSGPMLTRYALGLLYGADPSWNCFPSSHCAVIMTAALSLWHQGKVKGSYGILVALAIGLSTILTRQHYAVDALAGFTLAILVHCLFFRLPATKKMTERMEARAIDLAGQWLNRPISSQ